MPEDQALLEYAHAVVAGRVQGDHPFDGYYFRKFEGGGDAVYMAYPAEWHSSGVMTFVVTSDGKVYEKNLGTEDRADGQRDERLEGG